MTAAAPDDFPRRAAPPKPRDSASIAEREKLPACRPLIFTPRGRLVRTHMV
jgi:hypothetical protein